jgi:hypothetical protein
MLRTKSGESRAAQAKITLARAPQSKESSQTDEKLTAFVEMESLVRNEDRKADRDSLVTEAIALR